MKPMQTFVSTPTRRCLSVSRHGTAHAARSGQGPGPPLVLVLAPVLVPVRS